MSTALQNRESSVSCPILASRRSNIWICTQHRFYPILASRWSNIWIYTQHSFYPILTSRAVKYLYIHTTHILSYTSQQAIKYLDIHTTHKVYPILASRRQIYTRHRFYPILASSRSNIYGLLVSKQSNTWIYGNMANNHIEYHTSNML